MTEKAYSTQRVKNLGDRKIENPIHFTTPEEGVKVVYVQDGFDNVRDAYARTGAKVKNLGDLPASAPASTTDKKEK